MLFQKNFGGFLFINGTLSGIAFEAEVQEGHISVKYKNIFHLKNFILTHAMLRKKPFDCFSGQNSNQVGKKT